MDLSDRVSEDVIKIFHNAKGSIFNDVLKWTQALHDTHHDTLQANEQLDSHGGIYMAKENKREENPSIFGEQPVSEYSQQPFPPKENNDNEIDNTQPKDEEKSSEAEIEEQQTDEERSTLEGLKRDEEIEQHRSEYGGFIGTQR